MPAVRLFVAVNLPAAVRNEAYQAAAPLRDSRLPVRWVKADNLHVTLKFLGEVAPEQSGRIGSALVAGVRGVRAFSVAIGGIGAFPSMEHPRVVWIGVEKHPALELLANDVENALAPFGFGSELRPFHPHITLGRVGRGARADRLRGLENLAEEIAYEGMATVESVDLMESRPGPGGSQYRVLVRAALTHTT